MNTIICKNESYRLIKLVYAAELVQLTKIMITLLHRMIILRDFEMQIGWLIEVLHVNELLDYSFPLP